MDWQDRLVDPTFVGSKTTQVLRKIEVSQAGECWRSLAHGQRFWVRSESPAAIDDVVTFYGWLVCGMQPDGSVFIECDGDSKVVFCYHGDSHEGVMARSVVSLCSGLGGMDLGAHRVGYNTKVMCDVSELATKSLSINFGSTVCIVQGDLQDESTMRAVHTCIGCASPVIAAGFPCQPYSRLGDLRGFSDPRAQVLSSILRIGWLTQCGGIVLECVSGAGESREVISMLKDFCSLLGLQSVDGSLRLERLWPSRRCRWWFVGTPAGWPPVHFRDLPIGEWKTIKDLFHSWPLWGHDAERSLAWDDHETQIFRNPQYGKTDRRLQINGQAPTALHSQGAHFRPCPCGCRSKGFSEDRLLRGGVHSIEVRSGHDVSVSRHPHPAELGFLQGIDLGYTYAQPLKDQLCLVGQVASPFQAAWVFLLIEESRPDGVPVDAEGALLLFAHDLISQHDEKWTFAHMNEPVNCQVSCLGEPAITFRADGTARVGDFVAAQEKLVKGSSLQVFRHGRLSTPDDQLQAGDFICSAKEVDKTSGTISLSFAWCGRTITRTCEAGTRLFEIVYDITEGVECAVFLFGKDLRISLDTPIWFDSHFEIATLVRGGGKKTHALLQLVARDHELQRWFAERRADGTVHPGYDAGLDDVTMTYAARALIQAAGTKDLHFVAPRMTSTWLDMQVDEERDLVCNELSYFDGSRVLALIGRDGHWSVLDYTMHDAGAEATCVDGIADRLKPEVQAVASMIHATFGCGPISHVAASCFQQGDDNFCGAVALLHIGWRLGLWNSFDEGDVRAWYSILRWGVATVSYRGGGGKSQLDPLEEWLRPFLEGKGVPPDLVADRIQAAVKALGRDKIEEAIKSKNPWAQLKTIGNSKSRPFLWVHYDELRRHVEDRAKEKWGASADVPKRKGSGKGKSKEAKIESLLEPSRLSLVSGIFFANSKEVAQIDVSEVRSGATGIAFCRLESAIPYIADKKSISMSPLMLLIIDGDPVDDDRLKPMTVPACYKGTEEPVLVSCRALQLGDVEVCEKNGPAPEIGVLPTRVLRIQIFRDEVEDWKSVSLRPLKHLTDHIGALQLCREAGCDCKCGCFHPTVEENGAESAITDRWGWRWARLDGRKCSQADSEVLSLFLRVPESAFTSLLESSGHCGVYVEPRQTNGAGTDPAYSVIWLGGMSAAQVRHIVKTEDCISSIARLGTRFGVRTLEKHAEFVHKKVSPTKPFLKGNMAHVFRVGPVPAGSHRQGLQDAFKQHGWDIKPLHPVKGGSGCAWEVGARDHPPAPALRLSSGYVTITHVRSTDQTRDKPVVIASSKTLQRIKSDAGPSQYEASWGTEVKSSGDPWSQWLRQREGPSGVNHGTTPEIVSKIQSVEERVRHEVSSQLKADLKELVKDRDEDMGEQQAVHEERFAQLEADIQILQQQGARVEQWIQDSEQKSSEQSQQLDRVEAQIAAQTDFSTRLAQSLESCTSQISKQHDRISEVSGELQGLKGGIEKSLENFFSKQTAQIESMLAQDKSKQRSRSRSKSNKPSL